MEKIYLFLFFSFIVIIIALEYKNARQEDYIMKCKRKMDIQEKKLFKYEKVIDKMAENLTTDYHDKIWVINHYMEETKTEHKNKTASQNKTIFF